MMQISDPTLEERIPALFRLGFRPFFLAGVLFSMISLMLWGLSLFGSLTLQPYGGMLWWHMHEMVFGFTMAIIAGFLLTAVQTWTGVPAIKGKPLMLLFGLWLAGRVLLLVPGSVPLMLIAGIDIAFPVITAALMASYVIRVKMWRNLMFTPVLLLMALASGIMHAGVIAGDYTLAWQGAYGSIYLVALLMAILGGRVIPFFTANRLKLPKPETNKPRELGSIIPLVLLTLLMLSGTDDQFPQLTGFIALIAAIANLSRLTSWQGRKTLRIPLLWSLHLSYLFIVLGLFLAFLHYMDTGVTSSIMIHALTVGGIGGLILAMISRVSLGHTGRPLKTGKTIALSFILIAAAAIVRILPALLPLQTNLWLMISITLWLMAYGIFFVIYLPILSRPRVDGKSG
ncbi:NnrS family protein [Parendozoicomonas sp. Alg238-R29]|uniref:NnrS family protein n=1 Tax=Parendozoicomonas sp. Alg238-R29 TaxID=2993446 RepID=UPI00248F0D92|nr:NnrS family protein [Parendozoicomonas sp. Alg238-R29]